MDADINPMEPNPLKDGALTQNSKGLGTVTVKMIKDRALEIARMNGRQARELKPSDYVEAKRDLTGQPETGTQQDILESAPEADRWNPVPGSTGHKVSAAPSEDEDEEGRSDNERLVDEGVSGAEDDQSQQAAKDAAKKDS